MPRPTRIGGMIHTIHSPQDGYEEFYLHPHKEKDHKQQVRMLQMIITNHKLPLPISSYYLVMLYPSETKLNLNCLPLEFGLVGFGIHTEDIQEKFPPNKVVNETKVAGNNIPKSQPTICS